MNAPNRRRRDGITAARPTMQDVAVHAGVTAMTVSRALSAPERVSAEARARIDAAVQALGYVRNLAAGTLKSQKSGIVAAIVPSLRNSLFAETAEGLSEELARHGYQLLLANSGYSPALEEQLVATFLGRQPDAIVLTGVHHTRGLRALLAGHGVPVVETWDLTARPVDMVAGFSNREAAYRMTLALAARGYRNIVFVGTRASGEPRGAERQAGYDQAVAELSLRKTVLGILEGGTAIAGGAAAMQRVLSGKPVADAVLFVNDLPAAGALAYCLRHRIAVPDTIAVAGFGDFEIAAETLPALTTVRFPRHEMGVIAARLIAQRLSGEAVAEPVRDLGFELVFRESA